MSDLLAKSIYIYNKRFLSLKTPSEWATHNVPPVSQQAQYLV